MRVLRVLNWEFFGRIFGIFCVCIISGDVRDLWDFIVSIWKIFVEVYYCLWIVDYVGDNLCEMFGV